MSRGGLRSRLAVGVVEGALGQATLGVAHQLGQPPLGGVEFLLAQPGQLGALFKEGGQFAQGVAALLELGDDLLQPFQGLFEARLLLAQNAS